jgi:two-component system alkaline phosphatase synthesis response regulator PhoP
MPKQKILVIEDDNDIRDLIKHNLAREGYDVMVTPEGEKGLAALEKNACDLVILDLMLPGMHGLEVCRMIRANNDFRRTGILIVTAKDEEADIVSGLELGADDYLVKPFSVRVLLARARAVLRRSSENESDAEDTPMIVGPLRIDVTRHEVRVRNEPVELTLAEFRILQNLAKQPGRVLTRNQLLDLALGQDHFVLNRTVDVHVSSLRRKLGTAGEMVETVRGVGYRLKDGE